MQPLEIESFLKKFATGKHTEAEHQQFTDWLKTAPIAEVEAVLDKYNKLITGAYLAAGKTDPKLAANIEAAIDQYELGNSKKTSKAKIIHWNRFARVAAAVLILFIAGMSAWLVTGKDAPAKMVSLPSGQQKNEVVPGSNIATLTLGDG